MHLLATTSEYLKDHSKPIDLNQSPADVIFIASADSDVACIGEAQGQLIKRFAKRVPTLRAINQLFLSHPYTLDLYLDKTAKNAKIIVLKILGGRANFKYPIEQISRLCFAEGIPLLIFPAESSFDLDLFSLSTVRRPTYDILHRYLIEGSILNYENFLKHLSILINEKYENPTKPLNYPKAGIYYNGQIIPTFANFKKLKIAPYIKGAPTVAIVFYRALIHYGKVDVVDQLCKSLYKKNINPLPIFASSLRDLDSTIIIEDLLFKSRTALILNSTSFAVNSPSSGNLKTPFSACKCPVYQIIFASSTKKQWMQSKTGLHPRDMAMNIALPEVDGRIITRAVSFKGVSAKNSHIQADIINHIPSKDRCDFIAQMCANQTNLKRKSNRDKSIAFITANYPSKDSKIAGGVGLDVPQSLLEIFKSLKRENYKVGREFENSNACINYLKRGITNASSLFKYNKDKNILRPLVKKRQVREVLKLSDYEKYFFTLPAPTRRRITQVWGDIKDDAFFIRPADIENYSFITPKVKQLFTHSKDGAFALPIFKRGNMYICMQPARGYGVDAIATYHDPKLVPPHGYLAFYLYLHTVKNVDAFVHLGKHGSLEWLPGKSCALSKQCFPEVIFQTKPHFYPFIVNDPGEGTQAKRRCSAVIIDHMPPPLSRAETYGEMKHLEQLIDEYFCASAMDPRRLDILSRDIIDTAARSNIAHELKLFNDSSGAKKTNALKITKDNLQKIDSYLCMLKQLQIRNGLHIFGESLCKSNRTDILIALARSPRGNCSTISPSEKPEADGNQSIIRALALDFKMTFDPLIANLSAEYTNKKPAELLGYNESFRTLGDAIELLELFAIDLVNGNARPPGKNSKAVLCQITNYLAPKIDSCPAAELQGLLTGLKGDFVMTGPSGAPTRGRPDVLPTGKNFYSIDIRCLPTPSAWELGSKSAELLIKRYVQDTGDYLKSMLISIWGTSNMRTGGDDIAQILCLIGARPLWDEFSGHLTGYEIIPLNALGRPRVDVTVRISGFFRDAFPNLIALVDNAMRKIATLDEPLSHNPIKDHYHQQCSRLRNVEGLSDDEMIDFLAGARIFGSPSGGYGAGMQALMDEDLNPDDEMLANTYLSWGGFAYGENVPAGTTKSQKTNFKATDTLEKNIDPIDAKSTFIERLKYSTALVQNQDNREHDILDSDDYYQFEGGAAAAVRYFSKTQPLIYHNDHSQVDNPVIRSLNEEISIIVRARAANPKWIKSIMKHNYKGAFEIAATVDYLYAFAATSKVVDCHHFEQLFDAYIIDDEVFQFLKNNNPDALNEILLKFKNAIDRGFWKHQRRNSIYEIITNHLKLKK